MSYCRFSSNNGYCDVYVYHDVSGDWVIHVAGRRLPNAGRPISSFDRIMNPAHKTSDPPTKRELEELDETRKAWDKANPTVPIKHPSSARSFRYDTPGECAHWLKWLKGEGFQVPQHAIDELIAEQEEMQ